MLIDTRGWLGVEPIPLTFGRVVGVGLLVAGVILIQQK
ncbi:MAG: DMT family transporter [Halofilum sp. (in: g-proteobacteria)]